MCSQPMRIGVILGQWGWTFTELDEAWQAADKCGFDVIGCFDHVSAAPRGWPAWDAPSILTAMAASTKNAQLAVWVINVGLRHPLLLASQLAVAQAASGGRLEVGLGAGSYHLARFDHRAMGLAFPTLDVRSGRLEEFCRTLPRLWEGESVTEPNLSLYDASLGSLDIETPPLFVGGKSDQIMDIAVRHADGWNLEEGSPELFANAVHHVRCLENEHNRTTPLEMSLQVFADELKSAEMKTLVREYESAGANTMMFIVDEKRGAGWVEHIAKAVL